MKLTDGESYTRRTALITILWIVAMFVAGLLLITFSDAFLSVF